MRAAWTFFSAPTTSSISHQKAATRMHSPSPWLGSATTTATKTHGPSAEMQPIQLQRSSSLTCASRYRQAKLPPRIGVFRIRPRGTYALCPVLVACDRLEEVDQHLLRDVLTQPKAL